MITEGFRWEIATSDHIFLAGSSTYVGMYLSCESNLIISATGDFVRSNGIGRKDRNRFIKSVCKQVS